MCGSTLLIMYGALIVEMQVWTEVVQQFMKITAIYENNMSENDELGL